MATNHLTLEGLTGVGRVELELEPEQRVYALLGTNGVGKTKCLEALFAWLFLSHRALALEQELSHLLVLRSTYVEKIHQNGVLIFSAPAQPIDSSSVHDKVVVFLGAQARGLINSVDSNAKEPLNVGLFEKRRQKYWEQVLRDIRDGKLAGMGMQADISNWFVLRAHSASPYQVGIDNRKVEIETLLGLLNKADERIDPAFLEVDGANQVFIKVSGVVTQLQHLSSGFTSLLKMLQAIVAGFANFTNEVALADVPGIVFIDEIESHLHVSWQAKIIPLLKRLFPNTTFYVATHSPLVLSQLHQGEAYLLQREDDGVVRSHVVDGPNRKGIFDVLNDGLGLNLNQLKIDQTTPQSQAEAKRRMLALLQDAKGEQ